MSAGERSSVPPRRGSSGPRFEPSSNNATFSLLQDGQAERLDTALLWQGDRGGADDGSDPPTHPAGTRSLALTPRSSGFNLLNRVVGY
jgi:hypothetical protein